MDIRNKKTKDSNNHRWALKRIEYQFAAHVTEVEAKAALADKVLLGVQKRSFYHAKAKGDVDKGQKEYLPVILKFPEPPIGAPKEEPIKGLIVDTYDVLVNKKHRKNGEAMRKVTLSVINEKRINIKLK